MTADNTNDDGGSGNGYNAIYGAIILFSACISDIKLLTAASATVRVPLGLLCIVMCSVMDFRISDE